MPEPYEPVPTPDTRPFWDAAEEGRLRIQRCRQCTRYYFYPRRFCRYCASPDVEWVDVSGRARLLSYVINRRPLPGAEAFSPVIAVVELQEGPTMLTNVVDVDPVPENLPLDLPLTVAFQQRGRTAVPVFKPLEEGR
jgi:uncharacterized OB-fold protein